MHLCMYVISIIMALCNDGSVLKEQSYCACLLFRWVRTEEKEGWGGLGGAGCNFYHFVMFFKCLKRFL